MGRAARSVAAALGAAVLGCATPGDGSIPDWGMRERVRAVEVGQSAQAARAILRRDPVRRPGHPDDPFPSPLHALELTTPDGRDVRVEVYVVATRPAGGCPDVHYDDVPVTFVDGVVAGTTWEFVEWSWRGWGGALADLRAVQDRFRCPDPPAAPEAR